MRLQKESERSNYCKPWRNKVIKFIAALLITIMSSSLFAAVGPTVALQTTALNNPFPLPLQVNVTFSEPVAGFFPEDVRVTNGTVVRIAGSSCQPNFIITIQPTGPGNITVFIPENSAISVINGNPNQASNLLTIPAAVVIGPSVSLQTSALSNPFPSTFQVNVTFSEAVTNFVPAGVNVTNGAVINISGSPGQANYVLTIQPTTAGVVDVRIPANSAVSVTTGAPNQASNLLTIPAAVIIGPSVTLQSSVLTNPYPSTFPVTVTFSELVNGFDLTDINVTNGTAVSISAGCHSDYVIVIQPNGAGEVSVNIPANAVVSASTGAPNQASNLLSISGLNPNLRPSSNFNLSSWNLNLPLPLGAKSNPLSIGQPTLSGTPSLNNGYISPPYFFTDPATGAMNFFAPLNGGTSSVSGYSRSELIEVIPGTSPHWKLSTFNSNTLTASLLMSQVPAITKRTVIAEISNKGNTDRFGNIANNSPFVKLYYDSNALDPNNNHCNGCIYAQIRTIPAQSNYLKIVNLIQDIPLHKIFTYKLTLLRDGTLTIKANDQSTSIMINTSDNNTIGWGAQDFYFEAGVINLESGTSNTLGSAASYYALQAAHK